MRLAIIAALIAAPAFAENSEAPMLEQPCMDVIGPLAYGPKNFETGITAGTVFGYAVARGHSETEAQAAAAKVAASCKDNMGRTFGEALKALDQDD